MAERDTQTAQKRSTPKRGRVGPAGIEELLSVVMRVPRPWMALMGGLAVLSSVSVDHAAGGGWDVHFEVTGVTLLAFSLIWLPALLRLLSLTGGRFKGGGMEVSSGGLIGTPEGLIGDLTQIRTEAEEASMQTKATVPDSMLRQIQRQVDVMAAEYLGESDAISPGVLTQLANEYEAIRAAQESGNSRTAKMTRLVNEARVRASANRERARRLASGLIRSRREGERIVGLALLQEVPSASYLDAITSRIANSSSAFEMFHALVALREVAPRLEPHQADSAIRILKSEKSDPRGVGVMEDINLPLLIDEVIAALKRPDTELAGVS